MVKIYKDYDEFKINNIILKQSLSRFENGFFVSTRYNNIKGKSNRTSPIYIQTPKLTIPFGLSYNETISFSLEDADIDPLISKFHKMIGQLEIYSQSDQISNILKNLIVKKDKDIENIPLKFISPIKKSANSNTEYINFKIKQNNGACIYNTAKEVVRLDDIIATKTQGIAIIELLGYWIRKEDSLTPKYNYGLSFQIQQLMLDIIDPFSLAIPAMPTNTIIGSNNDLSIIYPILPPPPPPPLPPPGSLTDLSDKKSILQIINETKAKNNGNNTLNLIKKTYGNKQEIKPPTLDEILNKLKNLRSVDDNQCTIDDNRSTNSNDDRSDNNSNSDRLSMSEIS